MSDYGEMFSSEIPGMKAKTPQVPPEKTKRPYTKREKTASPLALTEAITAEEADVLTEMLGEYNFKIYRQAAVLVELLELVPQDRRRRAAALIAKIQQGTLKFF